MGKSRAISDRSKPYGRFHSAPHTPGDRSAGQRRYDDDNRCVSAANLQERQFRIATRRTEEDRLSKSDPDAFRGPRVG